MTRKIWIVCCAAGLVLGAVGCSGIKTKTTADEAERLLRDSEEEVTELRGTIGDLEREIQRKDSDLVARQEALSEARATAERAEEKSRAAAATTARTPSGDARSGSGSTSASGVGSGYALAAGTEMLPPSAKPGECYARVFVPPVYRTESERVLAQEAGERIEIVPARYEWATEKTMVKEASSRIEVVPAKYKWVEEKVLVKPSHTVWKKGRGPVEKVDNSTGEIMCLVEVPAEYKTVKKKVLESPAKTLQVEIPAEYTTVKVQRLVSPDREKRIPIPEEYETVSRTVQASDGKMEWRPVLCETNMSREVIATVQRSLEELGFDPGPIDGLYGPLTNAAVKAFQEARRISRGGLTMETIAALRVKKP